ncbi:hypothetical protein GF352_04825 [archaeon]|nr:hypothetical protein [archaeon]
MPYLHLRASSETPGSDDMTRRGVNILLVEVVSFLVFGITILVWFVGIESLVGNLDDSLAVRNFNKFLQPISSVCEGSEEALALGLDLNVFGRTFLVTQLTVPDTFRVNPEDYNMLPLPMKKCVGTNCLCLMDFKEFEGDWQMCTTAEWDVWAISTGIAPGCPFWYYAPPDMIEQMVSNLIVMLDIKSSLYMSFLADILEDVGEGFDRNYFHYPAPESWGGCHNADADNLVISSFLRDQGEFVCNDNTIKNKDLDYCFISQEGARPEVLSIVEANYQSNDTIVSGWFNKSLTDPLNAGLDSLMSTAFIKSLEGYTEETDQLNNDLIKNSFNDFKTSLRSDLVDLVNDNVSPAIGVNLNANIISANVVNEFENFFDKMINDKIISEAGASIGTYSLIDGNVSLVFNLELKPENLVNAELNLLLEKINGAEGLAVNINNKHVVFINPSQIDGNYVKITVPAYSLVFGTNYINLSNASGVGIGLTSDKSGLDSYRFVNDEWNALGGSDYNAYLTINQQYNNNRISSRLTGVLTPLLNQQVYNPLEEAFVFDNVFIRLLNNDLKSELTTNYGAFMNYFLSREVFDSDCSQVLDVRAELNTFESSLESDIESFFLSRVSDELSTDNINQVINDRLDLSLYDFTSLRNSFIDNASPQIFEQAVQEESGDLAAESWPYLRDSLISEIGDCASPVLDSLRDSFTSDVESLISDSLSTNLNSNVFKNALKSEHVKPAVINNEVSSIIDDLGSTRIPSLVNDVFNLYYYTGFDDFSLSSLIDRVNNRLRISSSNAISKAELSAWKGLDVTRMNCWPGPDGDYFEGFSTVNDLIAYNRYTSVSRLTPELLYFGTSNPFIRIPQAYFLTIVGQEVQGGFEKIGLTIEEFSREADMSTTFYEDLEDEDYLADEDDETIADKLLGDALLSMTGDLSSITGRSVWGKALFWLAKEEAKFLAEQLIKNYILYYLSPALSDVGINVPTSTIFMHNSAKWVEEIVYADGSTRTFNPNKIVPVSCFTMEELGCPANEVLWVDEDYACYTEIFVRNIGDAGTWLKLILGSDECINAYGRGGCSEDELSGDNICYRDTLTACFRMTCDEVAASDKRRVFQYWIGSSADPASFGPPMTGRISKLKVFRDENEDKIVLHVPAEGGVPLID